MLLVNAVNTEGRPVELFVRDGKIAAVGQDLEVLAGENEVVLDAGGLPCCPPSSICTAIGAHRALNIRRTSRRAAVQRLRAATPSST